MGLASVWQTALREIIILAVYLTALAIVTRVYKMKRKLYPQPLVVLFVILGLMIILSLIGTGIEIIRTLAVQG